MKVHKTRKVLALLLAVLMTAALSGCTGSGGDTTTAGTTAATTAVTSTAAPTTAAATTAPATTAKTTATTPNRTTATTPTTTTAAPVDTDPGAYGDEGVYRFYDTVEINAMIGYQIEHTTDAECEWMTTWLLDRMNIQMNIDSVPTDSMEERTSLVLMSGTLPDCFMSWLNGMRTRALQTQYGDIEGLLRPINDLITEETMPTLTRKIGDEAAAFQAAFATIKGNIYTFPRFLASPGANYGSLSYNVTWLAQVGYDNIYEDIVSVYDLRDALQAIKEQDPGGLGDRLIPLGSSYGKDVGAGVFTWLMNAFGFTTQTYKTLLSIRDGDIATGELVIVPRHEAYYAYLEYMNSLYEGGLLEPDVYTQDQAQFDAKVAEGIYAVHSGTIPYASVPDFAYKDWSGNHPLVSDYCDTPTITAPPSINMCYYTYITTDASDETVFAIAKLMDYGYDEEHGYIFVDGPKKGVDETYGLTEGWEYKEDGFTMVFNDVENGTYADMGVYRRNIAYFGMSGARFDRRDIPVKPYDLYDPEVPGEYYGLLAYENYYTPNYVVYALSDGFLFNEEDTVIITDLETMLLDYMMTETAKFITGVRDLTAESWDTFQAELDSMGMQQYADMQMAAFESQLRS